eukprot:3514228-Amphidinium_carterae.2
MPTHSLQECGFQVMTRSAWLVYAVHDKPRVTVCSSYPPCASLKQCVIHLRVFQQVDAWCASTEIAKLNCLSIQLTIVAPIGAFKLRQGYRG